MHSTATTAVSIADFSSVNGIKSLKVIPTLQAVPKLLVISTAVPIGVGVVLLTSGKNHFHEMNGDVGMAGWK